MKCRISAVKFQINSEVCKEKQTMWNSIKISMVIKDLLAADKCR